MRRGPKDENAGAEDRDARLRRDAKTRSAHRQRRIVQQRHPPRSAADRDEGRHRRPRRRAGQSVRRGVISRKVLASIILGIVGVLIMTWRIVRIPAHVVVINQSGTSLERVTIETEGGRIELGTLNNAETRRVSVDPTMTLRL